VNRLTDRSLEIVAEAKWFTDDRLNPFVVCSGCGNEPEAIQQENCFVDCIESALANILLTSFNTVASEIDSRQKGAWLHRVLRRVVEFMARKHGQTNRA